MLRREFSMLPPGDVRNCIVALAEEEQLLSQLFSYRFEVDSALKGHSLGNLVLAALTSITGSFDGAILAASEVLAIRGEIFPATLQDIRLKATCADGSELEGELEISGFLLGEAVVPRPLSTGSRRACGHRSARPRAPQPSAPRPAFRGEQ